MRLRILALLLLACLAPLLLGGCPGLRSGPGPGFPGSDVPSPAELVPRTFPEARLAALQALLAARETLAAAKAQALLSEAASRSLNARLDLVRGRIEAAGQYWKGGSEAPARIELDAAMSLLEIIKEDLKRYGKGKHGDAAGEGAGVGSVRWSLCASHYEPRAGDCAIVPRISGTRGGNTGVGI